MTKPPTGFARPRLRWITRSGFVLLVMTALILGYLGLQEYLAGPPGAIYGRSSWDIAYFTLQLFVLSSAPLNDAGPFPWPLAFARFAAPASAAYALFEAAQALFAGELRRLRRLSHTGHTVVVGETNAAYAVATRLRDEARRVVQIPSGDASALRAVGAGRARAVYACLDDTADSGSNVAIALAAARLRRSRPLRIYAQVSDPGLCLALRARRLALPETSPLHLDFFNLEELAARELLRTERLDVPEGAPHLMVVGTGAFARAIIVEYARQWRVRGVRPDEPVQVVLPDPAADGAVRSLRDCYRVVREVCRFTVVPGPAETYLQSRAGPAAHRTYLCQDDERQALRMAVTATRLWGGGPGSVVVRLDRLDHHRGAFHRPGQYLLDDLGGRLRLVGVTQYACVPMAIEEDLVERLAQAIHDNYLVSQIRRGGRMGMNDSMLPWHPAGQGPIGGRRALPEDRKEANRAQARHIGVKLARIGCAVAPCSPATPAFELRRTEVELLAKLEHERWAAERIAAGWSYRPVRDESAKHHDRLVPWRDLPEPERDKDRDAILNLPVILADAGLAVVRLPPVRPADGQG